MNREITTKKVGRQKKLTNPCPVIRGEVQIMVGSPKCITCQWFERYFKGYNEVKRWWLPNLQMWYVFFYRKNGGKIKGVLGRERTNNLLGSIL